MACHYLTYNTAKDFFDDLQSRNIDLILKMTKCILSASKRKKDIIDVFEIEFKNKDILIFSIDKLQYPEFLNNALEDLIKIEEYELCAEITKIINKKSKVKHG